MVPICEWQSVVKLLTAALNLLTAWLTTRPRRRKAHRKGR